MKNLKKVIATVMALGMVSTMGISTYADTIGDSQKTFYTGDVNLDGDVNGLDLLLLKKMLLGLTDLQQMYIDGDTLKKVEDTQSETKTIIATTFDVDVKNNTIHVEKQYAEVVDITLKVTDNTVFNYPYKSLNDLVETIPEIELPITYDSATNEIISIGNPVELVTIQANEYTIDVENNTIHVTSIGDTLQMHDLTLKVTDNTTFSGNFSNLEEVAKKLEDIKGLCIDITYNSITKEISHIAQISVFPSTVETITTYEYTVDVENSLINVKISDGEYLPIKVTEDTVFDNDIINLEGLSKLEEEDMYYKCISIVYHNNTNEAIEVNTILAIVEPIMLDTVTSKQDNLTIDIDAENDKVKLTGTGDNSSFSDTLNITIDTQITRNDETLTLDELSQITDYQYILISVEYNLDTKEVTKLSLMDINNSQVEKNIKTIEVGQNTDYDIIGVYNTNELHIAIDGGNGVFKVNDDTTYSGGISSLSDIKYPDWYLTISYYVTEDGENIVTNINGFPITVAQ